MQHSKVLARSGQASQLARSVARVKDLDDAVTKLGQAVAVAVVRRKLFLFRMIG